MATATRTRKPAAKKATAPKVDTYQVVTDQIVEMLENGTAPWHQPWSETTGGLPLSMSSKKPYRGINVLLLQMVSVAKGYQSAWWGTYKQIAERGGQVRKGEKGTQVVLWKPLFITDEETGKRKQVFFLRTFTVFNADQAEGELGLPVVEPRPQVSAIAECDAAVEAYLATGPRLVIGGDRASYSPALDEVRMPHRDQFASAEEYYGTLFHELIHSTGNEKRLARKDLLSFHYFGDENYSREELVAEMGAAFLAGITGIAAVTLSNSASYLASWVSALKGDKKLVVQAAAQAQKAADMVLGVTLPVFATDEEETPAVATAAA
jgi:antirestriction protein ArdC